jgi:hypothetical protein
VGCSCEALSDYLHYLHSSRMVGKRLYYVPTIWEERVAPFWAWRPWHLNALKVRFLILSTSWWETSSASGRIDCAFWPSHSAGRGPCGRISFSGYLLWGQAGKSWGKPALFSKDNRTYRPKGHPEWNPVHPLIEGVSEYL